MLPHSATFRRALAWGGCAAGWGREGQGKTPGRPLSGWAGGDERPPGDTGDGGGEGFGKPFARVQACPDGGAALRRRRIAARSIGLADRHLGADLGRLGRPEADVEAAEIGSHGAVIVVNRGRGDLQARKPPAQQGVDLRRERVWPQRHRGVGTMPLEQRQQPRGVGDVADVHRLPSRAQQEPARTAARKPCQAENFFLV